MAEHKGDKPEICIKGGPNWWDFILTDPEGNAIEGVEALTLEIRAGQKPKVTLELSRPALDIRAEVTQTVLVRAEPVEAAS